MRSLRFHHTYTRPVLPQAGFTLIEMMVTVALVAILATIAVPNMQVYVRNNRLNSTAQELVRTFQEARSEAVKRQATAAGPIYVVVCASSNPLTSNPTCTTGIPAPIGWIMFEDDNLDWDRQSTEPVITVRSIDTNQMSMVANGSLRISYAATGFANPAGTVAATQTPTTNILVCDSRGLVDTNGGTSGTLSVARGITVSSTGRPHMTNVLSAIRGMGMNCP